MKRIKRKSKKEELITDEVIRLHKSRGNGTLRRQVWIGADGKVTRYSLAYINHQIFNEDNGRVLGYDNAHNFHHKHDRGQVKPVDFKSFTDIEQTFQQEFEALHESIRKK